MRSNQVPKKSKITQLPILPCSASTAYKLQGETLDSEIIVDWKSEESIINKRQQAYLMLSRCTTREALITLHRFTEDLAKWFKPDKDVLEEDNRLKQLHNKLILERNKGCEGRISVFSEGLMKIYFQDKFESDHQKQESTYFVVALDQI